jgi:hypothetical protein
LIGEPTPTPLGVVAVKMVLRVGIFFVKIDVTVFAADINKVHVPAPVQSPLQPVNVESPAGVAVNVTLTPVLYVSVQSSPQSTPGWSLVTVPVPVPALITVRGKTPVPVMLTKLGLLAALCAMERPPVLAPREVGVNVTLTAHVAFSFGASALEQVFVCVNCALSAPVTDTPLIVSEALPVFVIVTVCALLVVLMS